MTIRILLVLLEYPVFFHFFQDFLLDYIYFVPWIVCKYISTHDVDITLNSVRNVIFTL